jgi:CheY-like chemotaxis protein
VVDDQPDAAEVLARLLASHGYEMLTARDGPEALAQAAAHPPQIALLDIALPGMDGLELAQRLRALCEPGLRIAALTGFGQEGDRSRAGGWVRSLPGQADRNRGLAPVARGMTAMERHHPARLSETTQDLGAPNPTRARRNTDA